MAADGSAVPELTLEQAYLSEAEAARLLDGRRERRAGRVMDLKAQLLGAFIKQLRPDDERPPPEEARARFRKMIDLFDEPAPASVRSTDLTCDGPAGPVPLRLYEPQRSDDDLPLLLYLHGGGWLQGGLDTHDGLCGKLAAWATIRVVAVDYRLAPEHKFPAGLGDCLAAWRWLSGGAAPLRVSRDRLAIGGDSAGANLTAAICQILAEEQAPMPRAQLLIYPSLELGWDLPSHHALADAYVLPRPRVLWYTECYLERPDHAADPRASPLRAPTLRDQPPTMIVTAGFDPLLDDGRLYAERLATAGMRVTYREFPGQIHAFVSLTRVIPQGNVCLREAAEWLRAQLHG